MDRLLDELEVERHEARDPGGCFRCGPRGVRIHAHGAREALAYRGERSDGLAPRDTVALPELDEDDLLRRVCRAADREWNGEMELDGPNRDLHAGTSSRRALAIRSAPRAPSRTGSAAGSPVSAAAFWIAA